MDQAVMIAYWGLEKLKRWPQEALRDVRIPDASKAFMSEVGLPAPGRRIGFWAFEWRPTLPYVPGSSQIRLLGNSYSQPILIDEGRGGCVVWGKTGQWIERYANASVEQLAESLTAYDALDQYDRKMMNDTSYDAPAQRRIVKEFRKRLKEIDATAVADSATLWSDIIIEMRVQIYSGTL